MIRVSNRSSRLWLAAAVVFAAVVTAVQTPATAAVPEAEPVARKMVVTSPQTTGPNSSVLSWGLERIDQRGPVASPRSYSFGNTGTGVTIYVLDSGVQANHPEFEGRVVDGWSYRASTTALNSYKNALQANTIDACPNDGSHAQNPASFDAPATVDAADKGRTDNDGHGTHVAGIAAGEYVGVAKDARVVPVRALDSCGNGTRTMILEGLAWIRTHHQAGERAVLNLSVGFGEQVAAVDDSITALMNDGIVVVAAAGNSASTACGSTPASTLGTISVGASTSVDSESNFSNFGECVDLFAPGGGVPGFSVTSAYPYLSGTTNTYAGLSGTSMAAPFVAGAVARVMQTMPAAPTNFATGPTTAWRWLSSNASTGRITYHDQARPVQTLNRLLFVPVAIAAPVAQATAVPAPAGATVSWTGAVAGTTYVATASPGGAQCTVVNGSSCTISGLTPGTSYTVSVAGSIGDGFGAHVETSVVAGAAAPQQPAPEPAAPPSVAGAASANSVSLSWAPSATPNVTYVVTSTPASTGCTTTLTQCTVAGLRPGINYVFSIRTQVGGAFSPTATEFETRPGFTVRRSTVARRSRTSLTSIVTTPSRGRKTWRESGACSISAGRLVAPARATTCTVVLRVAKSGSWPAMSTTVKVAVR